MSHIPVTRKGPSISTETIAFVAKASSVDGHSQSIYPAMRIPASKTALGMVGAIDFDKCSTQLFISISLSILFLIML